MATSSKQTWCNARDYVLKHATPSDWQILLTQYGITAQTLKQTSHRDFVFGRRNSLLEVLNRVMCVNLLEVAQ